MLLLSRPFIQDHVVDPPGHRNRFAIDLALDRHRDVVEPEQARQAIARDVVSIGVLEVDLGVLRSHVKDGSAMSTSWSWASCVTRPSDSVTRFADVTPFFVDFVAMMLAC